MNKSFKNKASESGYKFGKFCVGFGVLIILFSLPFICNDYGDSPINVYGATACITGYIIYQYGFYRTGGNYDEDEEWEKNK
jgi:hypothetical protein